MDTRRLNRGAKGNLQIMGNGGGNRTYVQMDRITQIPSPFHHNRPSPYSRRMPPGPAMPLIGSPFQIFSPRGMEAYPGLPPVPPYPFHNMDLTPRRRQGPVTRSRSAHRPQNKQSRLTVKPAPRPQLSARMSIGTRQEKAKPVKPVEKPVEAKPPAKQAKAAEKPVEKSKRESLRPEPNRRRSLAPVRTDFIERNKMNAGRRKSVDPTTLKDMRITRRQSLARSAKVSSYEPEPEIKASDEPMNVVEPIKSPEVVATEENDEKDSMPKEEIDEEVKENVDGNMEVSPPKRARLEKSETEEENKSPKQTTSLFLQYLDIKKDDLPDIVADYESQQAAPESSKHSKKSRCAIM